MVVYFTGTGNSRWCAEKIAAALGDELVDSFPLLRSGAAAALRSERPWVFVSPTYGWQLPRIFADFLRRGGFDGCRSAYFVMTCGSGIGGAERGVRKLCAGMGLHCRGVLPVVMPENYIALFDAPEEAEAREILRAARPVLDAGAACIREDGDFPCRPAGPGDRLLSGPVNAGFYRFLVKDKAFYATAACVGCGRCADACVLGNITLRDFRPVWGGRCTHCMACICGCPAGAVEYGGRSRGKPRYQCPGDAP